MSDVLLDLVSCATLRGQFPRGVPRRACLRRQLERKRDGKAWAPAHPACAACELGHQVRANVEAAGVELGTCGAHGTALVGDPDIDAARCEACAEAAPARRERPPCAECGSTSKHAAWCSRPGREPQTRSGVARESRPVVTLRGAPQTTLIWAGEVPDVPIAAPPRRGAGLTAEDERVTAARVREALARPTEVAAPRRGPPTHESTEQQRDPVPMRAQAPVTREQTNEPPAPTPAEEESMARKPLECCGSLGGAHKATCPKYGKKAPAPAAGGGRPRRPRREEGGPGARGGRRAA